jgi:hypothetical protein
MSKLTKAVRRLKTALRANRLVKIVTGRQAEEIRHQILDLKAELLQHQLAVKWALMDLVLDDRPLLSLVICPLCGAEHSRAAFNVYESVCMFGGGRLTRLQCPSCDVIFGPEKMLALSKDELSADYRWHYRAFTEGDSTASEIRAFEALRPKKGGVYLNFGSGAWSKSIDQLRSEGWTVYGYEPYAQVASEHVITQVDHLREMRFDGIFSNNVLEHLRYPVKELKFMRGLLAPQGRMAHATACFEYLYEFTRFHLYFFTGRSRDLLADLAGLETLDFIQDGHFMCQLSGPAWMTKRYLQEPVAAAGS